MKGRRERRQKVIGPPPLIYFAGLVLGVILDRVFTIQVPEVGGVTLLGASVPLATRLMLGVPLFTVAYALNASAVRAFREARTTILPSGRPSALVSTGPYRFSRNPMYVGMTIGYVALAIIVGSVWALTLSPVIMVVMIYGIILREEAFLSTRFGAAYGSYKRTVRRWL